MGRKQKFEEGRGKDIKHAALTMILTNTLKENVAFRASFDSHSEYYQLCVYRGKFLPLFVPEFLHFVTACSMGC